MNMRNFSKMEKIVVLIGVIAVVGVLLVYLVGSSTETDDAPTYQPQTQAEYLDKEFRRLGLVPNHDTAAWEMADAICMDSAAGMYPYSIARSITSNNYVIDDEQAMAMVRISIRELCPKFSDRIN